MLRSVLTPRCIPAPLSLVAPSCLRRVPPRCSPLSTLRHARLSPATLVRSSSSSSSSSLSLPSGLSSPRKIIFGSLSGGPFDVRTLPTISRLMSSTVVPKEQQTLREALESCPESAVTVVKALKAMPDEYIRLDTPLLVMSDRDDTHVTNDPFVNEYKHSEVAEELLRFKNVSSGRNWAAMIASAPGTGKSALFRRVRELSAERISTCEEVPFVIAITFNQKMNANRNHDDVGVDAAVCRIAYVAFSRQDGHFDEFVDAWYALDVRPNARQLLDAILAMTGRRVLVLVDEPGKCRGRQSLKDSSQLFKALIDARAITGVHFAFSNLGLPWKNFNEYTILRSSGTLIQWYRLDPPVANIDEAPVRLKEVLLCAGVEVPGGDNEKWTKAQEECKNFTAVQKWYTTAKCLLSMSLGHWRSTDHVVWALKEHPHHKLSELVDEMMAMAIGVEIIPHCLAGALLGRDVSVYDKMGEHHVHQLIGMGHYVNAVPPLIDSPPRLIPIYSIFKIKGWAGFVLQSDSTPPIVDFAKALVALLDHQYIATDGAAPRDRPLHYERTVALMRNLLNRAHRVPDDVVVDTGGGAAPLYPATPLMEFFESLGDKACSADTRFWSQSALIQGVAHAAGRAPPLVTLPKYYKTKGRVLTVMRARDLDGRDIPDEKEKPNLQDGFDDQSNGNEVVIVEGEGVHRRKVETLSPGDIILMSRLQPGFDVLEVVAIAEDENGLALAKETLMKDENGLALAKKDEHGLVLMSVKHSGTTSWGGPLELSKMLRLSITGKKEVKPKSKPVAEDSEKTNTAFLVPSGKGGDATAYLRAPKCILDLKVKERNITVAHVAARHITKNHVDDAVSDLQKSVAQLQFEGSVCASVDRHEFTRRFFSPTLRTLAWFTVPVSMGE